MSSLVKYMNPGDRLILDMSDAPADGRHISITLMDKVGKQAFLKIEAERYIKIGHEKQYRLP